MMDSATRGEGRDSTQLVYAGTGNPEHSVLPDARPFGLPLSVLTTALGLTLWVACSSVVLSIVEGLGAQPVRRLSVGIVLVLATGLAVWQRRAVCAALWRRPQLALVIAALQLAVVICDRLISGPYVAYTMTSIGIAVIVARARIVWQCVALLDAGYIGGVLLERSPAHLVHSGALAGVIGQALGYPFAALALLGLAGLFKRFVSNVEPILEDMRRGTPALTPALTQAIALPGMPLPVLAAGRPATVPLTPAEVRVVEGLAGGYAPKELARQWSVSVATVRSHIKHAKRKTGARTLRALAGLVARTDWPGLSNDDE